MTRRLQRRSAEESGQRTAGDERRKKRREEDFLDFICPVRGAKVSPVISFSEADALTYEEGMTDEELLRGISAYDDVDGDVSDSLKVEFVAADPENGTVTVTYAARDKSNNVAKASQILKYQSESETRKKSGN